MELQFAEIVWPDFLDLPWDFGLYEQLVNSEGEPYYVSEKGGIQLNHPFFVAKFEVEHLVIHEPDERRFYSYEEGRGLWVIASNRQHS